MSYSYQAHTTSASKVTYTFSFAGDDPGYISTSAILVEVRTSGDTEWSELSDALWNLTGTNQITLVTAISAPTDGLNNLRIRRVVDKEKPYASFVRGSMLDMVNLDSSFIQLLEGVQEILDGFFPVGFYFQQNMNMNGHKFYNLGDGVDAGDSVNKGQVDALDAAQTVWNTKQDERLGALENVIAINKNPNWVEYATTLTAATDTISPPYKFGTAIGFLGAGFQSKILGAFKVENNKVIFSEVLPVGTEVTLFLGTDSLPLPSNYDSAITYLYTAVGGETSVVTSYQFTKAQVSVCGLRQAPGASNAYTVSNGVINFTEALQAGWLVQLDIGYPLEV